MTDMPLKFVQIASGAPDVLYALGDDGSVWRWRASWPWEWERISGGAPRGESGIPSSVVLAVDPSWSTPDAFAPAVAAAPPLTGTPNE